MLEVKLFGAGEVSYCSKTTIFSLSQIPGQLFCYLLLNRDHFNSREHLAAVFWSDISIKGSKKALRSNIWRLKQFLREANIPISDYLLLDEDHIAFNRSSKYKLDIEEFENLVLPCKDIHGRDLSPAQTANLEKAISLYSGDLLEGIFDDWCLYERERFRLLYLNILNKLMIYFGLHQTYEQAIEYGKRLLFLDNTLEKVHRQLMWLYWMNGDRNAALTQYKLCYQILHEELACNPMHETQRIYKLMLLNRVAPSDWAEILGTSSSITPYQKSSSDPICDRIQRELHRLQDMIEDTRTTSRVIEQLIQEALDK